MEGSELETANRLVVKTSLLHGILYLSPQVLLHWPINVPKVPKLEFPYFPLGEPLYPTTENLNILKLVSQSY